MLRFSAGLALVALAVSSVHAEVPARSETPAPPPLSPAAKNAIVNAPLPQDQAAMKSHVMFLASDALRGRDTGSPEFDIAAQYVAAQFYQQGLRPAGDDGAYLQHVPLVRYQAADKGSFTLTRPGAAPVALKFGAEYLPSADPAHAETRVEGQVVFAGYGIVAPHLGRDDYAGVDVKGKIVALFAGAPESFPGEERAHFGGLAAKLAIAASRGAVGVVTLESFGSAQAGGFAKGAEHFDRSRIIWANPDGTGHADTPGTPSLGGISAAAAEQLFAGARTPWKKILKRSRIDGARFRAEVLPARLAVTLHTATTPLSSANVVGMLPGSDPVLKNEVVVLSAHLDHIGVGDADTQGDTINNGAMDDAVGIATLIEEARRFRESGKAPRRTILFLAVTAEEKGLVGSSYFAHHPTVPTSSIVADVNLDMPILTYRFQDVVAFGAEHSTLGPLVRSTAEGMGLVLSPDPLPEEGIFVRSDHYRFVQQGIPAVFLWPGEMGPGKAAVEDFLANRYHRPSDEVSQPFDWESGVRFVEINYRVARAIADADRRPAWNKGDFFGKLYHGYGAE